MITAVDKLRAIRDAGFRVYVSHRRHVRRMSGMIGMNTIYELQQMTRGEAKAGPRPWEILPNGGETHVEVVVVDSDRSISIARGQAVCSTVDRFEKRKGLELAMQRAVASAPELRAVVAKLAQE